MSGQALPTHSWLCIVGEGGVNMGVSLLHYPQHPDYYAVAGYARDEGTFGQGAV